MGWIRKRLINLQKRHFGGAFLLLGSGRDIIRTFLKGCAPLISSTLFTSTSDFVYIEGLGYQVNRHLAHAEFCVRKMSTPGRGQKEREA